jgi:DAK2 domain fusion protein YloV
MTSNPSDFIPHIAAATKALQDHKDEVNRLNVFPVPDGDTGTNMALTLEAVLSELLALSGAITLADIRRAITHGSLMGARGNSGVITSQILRGVCDGLIEAKTADAATVSKALDKAVEVAFSAVRKPVEGTILTVLRDVADMAREYAEKDGDINDTLLALKEAAYVSVRRTPELLPILKENGVVDAGGYGLALLIDGFVSSLTGEAAGVGMDGFAAQLTVRSGAKVAIEQINDWEGSDFLYCTEFLFHGADLDVEAAQDFLASMGDCELLVGDHPDFKMHVHTNEPGTVLSYMTERGQVSEVHIHNMRQQSAERLAGINDDATLSQAAATGVGANAAIGSAGLPVAGDAVPLKDTGFIAVASGSGMTKILKSLGVDFVVSGGQTMNPSTKELLEAIGKVAAENVFIFPNNTNIILTANAAADVATKRVAVIPTTSVPQSFSALFVYDQDASFEDNRESMDEVIGEVRTGEVTLAVKDAKTANGHRIRNGDTIGIMDDSIEVVGDEVAPVALELIGHLARDGADTLTILAGEDLSQDDFEALLEQIDSSYPELEVDSHRGEQPLYPLVMSVE